MNRFLLKNDTTENVSARVSISPSDELGNLGHEGATVIEGDRLTTCLAPTAVAFPEPTGHRSQCFELNDNGRYAVEINGVVQPYAFTPADLMNCFNGQHESQVRFLECMRPAISCDGANSQVSVFMSLPWQAESGGAINLYNDETNELISEIQGYYLSPPDYNMADRLSPDVTYITANSEGNSTQTDYGNYRVTQQLISYRNTTDNPVRLRFEILHSSENEFPKTIFTEETEFHHNPTLFLIEETQDYSVYGVCLAPAEAQPEISCDGAVPVFEAKTSFETNVIEVSVDGGPWSDINSAEGIFVSFVPGNPGADIRFNLDGSEPKRVRVRTSRDIGLYVNPLTGFNQINTNKAYTLYDRSGIVIDPLDPKNHDYSGSEFDDTTTSQDFAVFFAEAEFCLAPIPEETVTVNKPFLEYKNNPTFSSLFSYMSMEYNGKVYTAYHIGFGSSIRDPLLAMLIGEWKAADGEIIKPIGSNIGYEDVYSVPRHFKLVDNAGGNGNIAISGFGDNSLLPNLTFTEDPAVMKFIITPSTGIAPPPEQPEREWTDLISVYGAGQGGVGDIHFDIEMKTMGYCKK